MNVIATTRFAPSPTGYLHIGGVRTALYNWLYARQTKRGRFFLRIDDTDEDRNIEAAVKPIFDGLTWLGITWDAEPMYQSRRKARYAEVLKGMLESGLAYEDAGCVRYRLPHWDDGVGIGHFDLVRGRMGWDDKLIKDPVIRRSDGGYLYNFATVVDDHDMGITHVLRGEEHLSNTPIQCSIFRMLGWNEPKYGHLPFICAPGSTKKLSKRDLAKFMTPQVVSQLKSLGFNDKDISERNDLNPVLLGYYQIMGYLPDALVNYLARLGWSLDGETEIFSRTDLVNKFSIFRVQKAPAGFDPGKLLWLNGEYMKGLENKAEVVASYLEKLP